MTYKWLWDGFCSEHRSFGHQFLFHQCFTPLEKALSRDYNLTSLLHKSRLYNDDLSIEEILYFQTVQRSFMNYYRTRNWGQISRELTIFGPNFEFIFLEYDYRMTYSLFHGATAPVVSGPPQYRRSAITLRHTISGRTPLDKWSDRHGDVHWTTHYTQK